MNDNLQNTVSDLIEKYIAILEQNGDPDEGYKLWERMSAASGGGSSSSLLSTHPSNQSRIAHLKELAPKVKAEAKKYGVTRFE